MKQDQFPILHPIIAFPGFDEDATPTPTEEFDINGLEPAIEQAHKEEESIEARPFFGRTGEARIALQREQPHHRAIAILLAQGFSVEEIIAQTGWSSATVRLVRDQPWAQKIIVELQERAGRKIVLNELQGAALEAARTQIAIMRGEGTESGNAVPKAADRAKAASDILNRCYGCAPQTIKTDERNVDEMTTQELLDIALGRSVN